MSRHSLTLFSLSALALSMQTVYAQTNSAPNEPFVEATLDEIVIIGSKENARNVAGSSYYVDNKQLENEKITDMNQVMKTVPGVYVTEEDGLGLRPNISIRAGVDRRSNKVHLMEDGVPIAPAPYAAPAAYYHPTAMRMSSVEILKGAPLLRYGPQTTGGVINYQSTPIPTRNGGKATASINNRGGVDVHAYAGGRSGDFAGMIETVQRRGKGFKKINGERIGDHTNQDYVLKGRYQLTPEHSIHAKVQHSRKSSDETYLGLTDEDFKKDPNMRYPATEKDNMKNEHTGINLTHNWLINENADLRTTMYYNKTHRNWYKLNDKLVQKRYSGARSPKQLHGQDDITGLEVKHNDRDYKSMGIQTNLNIDISTGFGEHNINVGGRIHKDTVERYQPVDTYDQVNGHLTNLVKGTSAKGGDNRIEKAQALSLWATDSWKVTDPLTLNMALRFENIKTEEHKYAGPGRKQGADTSIDNSYSIFLPGVSGTYQLNDNVQILAGVHKGFIPASIGIDGKKIDKQNLETSINYEIGSRYINGDNYLEAIGFYSDFNGFSTNCTLTKPCKTKKRGNITSGSLKLADKAVISGLELTAGTKFPMDGYTIPLSASYTYTSAKLTSDFTNDKDTSYKKGDLIANVPTNAASVRTGVEMANGWNTYVTAKYISAMCEDDGCNRTNTPKTDSLFTMDVATHYPIAKGATIFGKVENIADTRAIVSRKSDGARPNQPRTFTVGLTKEF